MTARWSELFNRATEYDLSLEEVREAYDARAEGDDE